MIEPFSEIPIEGRSRDLRKNDNTDEVIVFDNLDRYLIAGLGLLCGGLILLRKKTTLEPEVTMLELEPEVVDNRPNAIVISFPFHMRPLYNALPRFNPNKDAEIFQLSAWKTEHLQQVQVRQMNG